MISQDYNKTSSQLVTFPSAHFINTNSVYFKTSPDQESKNSKKKKKNQTAPNTRGTGGGTKLISITNSRAYVHIGLRCGAASGRQRD